MPQTIRGPLPPAVYWRRRAVVIGVALLLLILLIRIVHGGGSSQAASDGDTGAARTAARQTTPSAGTTSSAPVTKSKHRHRHRHRAAGTGAGTDPSSTATSGPTEGPTQPVLAAPTGTCKDNDVRITPTSITGTAGEPVGLALGLRTRTETACTWHLSYHSLALTVVHHGAIVWSSGQCPQQVPDTTVVVRRAVSTPLTVTWDGHTSEAGCPRDTAYAAAGGYRVSAASIGGLPASSRILLQTPVAAPTSTPTTTASPSARGSGTPSSTPTGTPSSSPSSTPSSVPTKRHRTMPVR